MAFRGYEIAIVGAGIGGLAAALYLRQSGHVVTVYDRFERPRPVGSGLLVQPTGQAVLADLGLLARVEQLGQRITHIAGTTTAHERLALDVRYGALGSDYFGIGIARGALFAVLHSAVMASDITLMADVEVQAIDHFVDRVYLVDRMDQRFGPYDLVVDASGLNSPLRRFAASPRKLRLLKYGALWTTLNARDIGFAPTALRQRYHGAGQMAGLLPIGRPEGGRMDRTAFFWSLRVGDFEALRARGIEAFCNDLLKLWPEAAPYAEQLRDFDQFTLARYGHMALPKPIGKSIAFVGDSAHAASPQLGQGANMALLDAKALGLAMGARSDIEQALAHYARLRAPKVWPYQVASRIMTPFYQSDSRALGLVRDWALAPLSAITPVPQILAATVGGTLIDPLPALKLGI